MEPIVSEIERVRPDAAEWAIAVPVAKPRQAGEHRKPVPASPPPAAAYGSPRASTATGTDWPTR